MSRTDETASEGTVPDDRRGDEAAEDRDRAAEAPLVETAHDATEEPGPPVIEVDAERSDQTNR